MKTKITYDLLMSRGLVFYLLLVIVLGIAGVQRPYLGVIAATLLFTVYDIYGYESIKDKNDLKSVQGYRITQNMFFILLLILTANIYGFKAVISFFVLHRFGVCDFLYYLIGHYRIEGEYTWLTWTPLLMVRKLINIIRRKTATAEMNIITPFEFVVQALAGIGVILFAYLS